MPEVLHVYLLADGGVRCAMQEVAVGAAPRGPLQLDLDEHLPRPEVLRPQEEVNSAGIVGERIVEVLILFVPHLEMQEERSQLLAEGGL